MKDSKLDTILALVVFAIIGILLALLYVLMRSAPGKKQNNVQKSDPDKTTQAGWLFAYAVIVVFLVILIFFFYHFTRYFA